jgi:hypothetical protein
MQRFLRRKQTVGASIFLPFKGEGVSALPTRERARVRGLREARRGLGFRIVRASDLTARGTPGTRNEKAPGATAGGFGFVPN